MLGAGVASSAAAGAGNTMMGESAVNSTDNFRCTPPEGFR
jgi:hypothetical protein